MSYISVRQNRSRSQSLEPEYAILVVEDQPSTAMMLKSLLESRLPCRVVVAGSLHEAKHALQNETLKFSVAVSDLNLPDCKLEEIIDVIRKCAVPIIALTGHYTNEMRDNVIKRGVVDYVLKDSFGAFDYIVDLVKRLQRNRGIKALVVDDSSSARLLVKYYLEQLGLEAYAAQDPNEGLQLLEQFPDIQIIVTDYEMPVMNGVQFTAQVRKKFDKDTVCILGVSTSLNSNLTAQFLKNGANDFFNKPFIYEEFLCRVNQNLEMLDLIQTNKKAATRDFLTGLNNRRHFFEKGIKLYNRAVKESMLMATAVIDIDYFKLVNDTYGHDIGDIALKQTAKALAQFFPNDWVARLGGEEFGILFLAQDLEQVHKKLELFRAFQEHNPLVLDGGSIVKIEVSIGGAMHKGHDNLDLLLKEADDRLYMAKHQGRNQIVMPSQ